MTSGRSSTPRTTLKMAALAPIPSASVTIDGEGQALGSSERAQGEPEVGEQGHDRFYYACGREFTTGACGPSVAPRAGRWQA